MAEKVSNRFNLVDKKWIPIANHGLTSLADIFSQPSYAALGGNPTQKIALTKLLLAIAQAAYTPNDDEGWKNLGAQGMAKKSLAYLKDKRDCFWLYGEKPFLQMPAIVKAAKQSFGAVSASVATGNTTVLLQSQIEQNLTDAEKTLLIIELGNFALGGKKTDNSIVLSPGYTGKSKTGKSGPALGYMGFLHNFLIGSSILESLWLNLLTKEQIISTPHFTNGVGVAPWEEMPTGEDCAKARELKTTYLGRLVPLGTFALLADDGLHYSEGIHYPGYLEGGFDISIGVDFSAKKPRAFWVDTEKRPWRQLTSLLAFLANEENTFDCYQLRLGLSRAKTTLNSIGIWSGGLKVSDKAGEKFFSATDDFVESEFSFESSWLEKDWFLRFKSEMINIEDIARRVKNATYFFHKSEIKDSKGKDKRASSIAEQAQNLFWQLSEQYFQALINACGTDTAESLRPIYAQIALKAYDTYCPKDTARQLDAWAASRPQLGKYFNAKVTL